MSNETANRSHAGLVLQMFLDPTAPRLLAAWGFEAASLTRLGVGLYSIRLTDAASGLVGPTAAEFESIDSLLTQSEQIAAPGLFIRAALVPDPALPPPAVGQRAQLPILAISTTDDSGAVDAAGVINIEVRAVPQQD